MQSIQGPFYKGDWVVAEDRTGVKIEAQVESTIKRNKVRSERRLELRIDQSSVIAIDTAYWLVTVLHRNLIPYRDDAAEGIVAENNIDPPPSQENHTL